jgi:signal transduction histidine kinase
LDLQPRHITLSIRDDGKGFDSQRVTSDHLGLGIMRERVGAIGGTLVIESQPGSGTLIRVRWKS